MAQLLALDALAVRARFRAIVGELGNRSLDGFPTEAKLWPTRDVPDPEQPQERPDPERPEAEPDPEERPAEDDGAERSE